MTTLLSAPIMMRLAEPPHQHTGANIPEIEFVAFCFIAILLMMWLVLERD